MSDLTAGYLAGLATPVAIAALVVLLALVRDAVSDALRSKGWHLYVHWDVTPAYADGQRVRTVRGRWGIWWGTHRTTGWGSRWVQVGPLCVVRCTEGMAL